MILFLDVLHHLFSPLRNNINITSEPAVVVVEHSKGYESQSKWFKPFNTTTKHTPGFPLKINHNAQTKRENMRIRPGKYQTTRVPYFSV